MSFTREYKVNKQYDVLAPSVGYWTFRVGNWKFDIQRLIIEH